jgi:hypothetical protein
MTANAAYSFDFGTKADLALPPAQRFAILTCMDARLDPKLRCVEGLGVEIGSIAQQSRHALPWQARSRNSAD